jgi:hypothetical protein
MRVAEDGARWRAIRSVSEFVSNKLISHSMLLCISNNKSLSCSQPTYFLFYCKLLVFMKNTPEIPVTPVTSAVFLIAKSFLIFLFS